MVICFKSRGLRFTKHGPDEKDVLSVSDETLSDASWPLMQVDVRTVNIPGEESAEKRMKGKGDEDQAGLFSSI